MGFSSTDYAGPGLVNDIVSLDNQNKTHNREMFKRRGREGGMKWLSFCFILGCYGSFWLVFGHFG